MSSCLHSETGWQPILPYSGRHVERKSANVSALETSANGILNRQCRLRRSESGSKLKVIEELSSQIKSLQTELEKAYEEIERLKNVRKSSVGLERVKGSIVEEDRNMGHRSASDAYFAMNSDRNKLTRKRSFPIMEYNLSNDDLQNLQLVESRRQSSSSYLLSDRNSSENLLETDSGALKTRYGCGRMERSCVPNRTCMRNSNSFNDFCASLNTNELDDRIASISDLSDRLGDPKLSTTEFESYFSAPISTAVEKDWNRNAFSETTSPEEKMTGTLEMPRDSFTYSDFSAAECFSDDIDSLSLGSIFDDVTINADDPIWSFSHLYSDWQL